MRLSIDPSKVNECYELADGIAAALQRFIVPRSTVAIERAVCRLIGIGGARNDYPVPNSLIDGLHAEELRDGAFYWICNAVASTGQTPQQLAEMTADSNFVLSRMAAAQSEKIHRVAEVLRQQALGELDAPRSKRETLLAQYGERPTPWRYVIVASGNIFEDTVQAASAVRHGADVIAVIRSTAQSLMDYVPEGLTTEGFGGTYATRANFRLMRAKLDEESSLQGRYVRLANYASGLCMPEMAVLGALERLDMMLSDSMYGILFRDINMQRTFIDQHFARRVQARSGMIINTGEDNYLTTDDAYQAAHTVLASQFINRSLANKSGLRDEQIGLGGAFEMDPEQRNGLLYEMADALLSRTCFPTCPLKYMPPTRHLSGDIFKAHVMNALFNLTSVATRQHIHLVGMLTEGIHTPLLHDRAIALDNVNYVMRYAEGFFDEFELREDGVINHRASSVLGKAKDLLAMIVSEGIFSAIEQGLFAGVRRTPDGGKGLEGVFTKSEKYLEILPFNES